MEIVFKFWPIFALLLVYFAVMLVLQKRSQASYFKAYQEFLNKNHDVSRDANIIARENLDVLKDISASLKQIAGQKNG